MPMTKVMNSAMKNFHLPLPGPIYAQPKAEAERQGVSAIALAREAIDQWLRQHARRARHDAIAAYAAEMAGTEFDPDTDLEAARVDHLLQMDRRTR